MKAGTIARLEGGFMQVECPARKYEFICWITQLGNGGYFFIIPNESE